MDTDLGFILEKLGLTKAEILVFSTLVQGGSSGIGNVIKKSQLHRGTVYNTLQRLIQKGLVYTSDNDGVKIYGPNQQGFLSDLADERARLMEKSTLMREVKKRIKLAKFSEGELDGQVKVLQGVPAFKNFFLNLFQNSRKTEETYSFLGNGGHVSNFTGLDYYKFSQELKRKLGVKCRVILNEGKREHPDFSFVTGNIKWVAPEYDFGKRYIWLYDNKVVTVDWGRNPIKIEVDEDKENFRWHNSVYKAFWKGVAFKRDEYLENNFWKKKSKI